MYVQVGAHLARTPLKLHTTTCYTCECIERGLNTHSAGSEFARVQIQHVYREFNAEADSLANEGLDAYNPRIHRTGIVVDYRWSRTNDALSAARLVDDDGDFILDIPAPVGHPIPL